MRADIGLAQGHLDQNKAAWQHRAYEYFVRTYGEPAEEAARIRSDPMHTLRLHRPYLPDISGLRIANPCGSHGRIATALALLGAKVTIFDISAENRRYAMALSAAAGVSIEYIVGDFCSLDRNAHAGAFDLVLAELGILHYFHDIDRFMETVAMLLRDKGTFLLSDFHPLRKALSIPETGGDYFDQAIHESPVAYQRFFADDEQAAFPSCSLRYYTLSDILNATLRAGLTLRAFDEHPDWDDKKLPGYYHLVAAK
ncbi:MAG: class I SAM-dependent methyltransferase [Oscillospiraceae bacterium]|nr:class I SAM-dependent methyltransferase [Oscillospiraceae bacterium]